VKVKSIEYSLQRAAKISMRKPKSMAAPSITWITTAGLGSR